MMNATKTSVRPTVPPEMGGLGGRPITADPAIEAGEKSCADTLIL